jgi:hypothetical protein
VPATGASTARGLELLEADDVLLGPRLAHG